MGDARDELSQRCQLFMMNKLRLTLLQLSRPIPNLLLQAGVQGLHRGDALREGDSHSLKRHRQFTELIHPHGDAHAGILSSELRRFCQSPRSIRQGDDGPGQGSGDEDDHRSGEHEQEREERQ